MHISQISIIMRLAALLLRETLFCMRMNTLAAAAVAVMYLFLSSIEEI